VTFVAIGSVCAFSNFVKNMMSVTFFDDGAILCPTIEVVETS